MDAALSRPHPAAPPAAPAGGEKESSAFLHTVHILTDKVLNMSLFRTGLQTSFISHQ